MKVLLVVAGKDWANLGYILGEALKSVGVEAFCVAQKSHHYRYSKSAYIYKNQNELKTYGKWADILQFMHSRNVDLNIGNQFDGRKGIAVFHGGSDYRNSPTGYNSFWNKKVGLTLIQTADLLGLGAANEVWFLPPIDTNALQPNYNRRSNKKVIAHYPSRASVKGTNEFNKLMGKLSKDPNLKNKFVYDYGTNLSWSENIKRLAVCDIYFDACQPYIGDKPYGFWGMAALEASALGKVVLTHFNYNQERYLNEYGQHNLKITNSMEDVERHIRKLILMDDETFKKEQEKTRAWVVEQHSYKVVGARLVDIYNEYLTWDGKE